MSKIQMVLLTFLEEQFSKSNFLMSLVLIKFIFLMEGSCQTFYLCIRMIGMMLRFIATYLFTKWVAFPLTDTSLLLFSLCVKKTKIYNIFDILWVLHMLILLLLVSLQARWTYRARSSCTRLIIFVEKGQSVCWSLVFLCTIWYILYVCPFETICTTLLFS